MSIAMNAKRADPRVDGQMRGDTIVSSSCLSPEARFTRSRIHESPINGTSRMTSGSGTMSVNQLNGGDSDGDSGIVALGPSGASNRVGSTSSTDTDPETVVPINGPGKGRERESERDSSRSRLNEPKREEQQKGSVSFKRVRFDDELHLSEQNIRRSCRKPFAALYPPQAGHVQGHVQSQIRTSQSGLVYPSPGCASPIKRPLSYAPQQFYPHQYYHNQLRDQQQTCCGHCLYPAANNLPLNVKPLMIPSQSHQSSQPMPTKQAVGGLLQTVTHAAYQQHQLEEQYLHQQYDPRLGPPPLLQPGQYMRTPQPNMYKSQSCWTLSGSLNTVETNPGSGFRVNIDPKLSDSCSTVNKLCAIDPLESTDSMVCAFATVANVTKEEFIDARPTLESYLLPEKKSTLGIGVDDVNDKGKNTQIGWSPDNQQSDHLYETIYPTKPSKSTKSSEHKTDARSLVPSSESRQAHGERVESHEPELAVSPPASQEVTSAILVEVEYPQKSADSEPHQSHEKRVKAVQTPTPTPTQSCQQSEETHHHQKPPQIKRRESKETKRLAVTSIEPETKVKSILKADIRTSRQNSGESDPNQLSHIAADPVMTMPMPVSIKSEAVSLPPDQVYPSNEPGFRERQPSSGETLPVKIPPSPVIVAEVEYAVITKDLSAINSSLKKLTVSDTCLSVARNSTSSMDMANDSLDSAEDPKEGRFTRSCPEYVPKVPPKTMYQSELVLATSCEETSGERRWKRDVPNKSFLQRFSGMTRAISRAFSTEKIYKPRREGGQSGVLPPGGPLVASLSAPALPNRSDQRSVHFRDQTNCSPDGQTGEKPQIQSQSFVKSLKTRMSFRRSPPKVKVKVDVKNNKSQVEKKLRWQELSSSREDLNSAATASADGFWGEIVQIKSNGSQVIELHRPKGRPFGFFVARGTVNKIKGVFVSRMRDEETQSALSGLLEIGDEIIAIDSVNIKLSNVMQVNQLMANKNKISLTIVPYKNQK